MSRFGCGHPNSFLRELLPKGSLNRIYEHINSQTGLNVTDPEMIQFKHLTGYDSEELISIASGRGVSKDTLNSLRFCLCNLSHWEMEPGSRIPFDEARSKRFNKKKTPYEMLKKLEADDEDCGSYVLLKNKHASAMEMILKTSTHPLAKEILSDWQENIIEQIQKTITQDAPFIEWKESQGGYVIINPKSTYSPDIDVFARWDAVVLNHNVTLIQAEHDLCSIGCEMQAYLDIDTNPKLLCECGLDFQNINTQIIKVIQSLYPAIQRYAVVTPENTSLYGHKHPDLIQSELQE